MRELQKRDHLTKRSRHWSLTRQERTKHCQAYDGDDKLLLVLISLA